MAAMIYLMASYAEPGDPRCGPYVLAVEHLASGELLGHVGFSPIDGEVEVSYAIAESRRGHGYGTEALAQGCLWLVQTFGVTTIVAATAAANQASRRLLERVAFRLTCVDVAVFQGQQEPVARYRWTAPPPVHRG